mmetsp:Transcript_13333/g.32715  ORF Transcript_13333/g.32715 Transcript_13333/m.32715 type:complete len:578 (-) Transcript_13333:85-1818(-)
MTGLCILNEDVQSLLQIACQTQRMDHRRIRERVSFQRRKEASILKAALIFSSCHYPRTRKGLQHALEENSVLSLLVVEIVSIEGGISARAFRGPAPCVAGKRSGAPEKRQRNPPLLRISACGYRGVVRYDVRDDAVPGHEAQQNRHCALPLACFLTSRDHGVVCDCRPRGIRSPHLGQQRPSTLPIPCLLRSGDHRVVRYRVPLKPLAFHCREQARRRPQIASLLADSDEAVVRDRVRQQTVRLLRRALRRRPPALRPPLFVPSQGLEKAQADVQSGFPFASAYRRVVRDGVPVDPLHLHFLHESQRHIPSPAQRAGVDARVVGDRVAAHLMLFHLLQELEARDPSPRPLQCGEDAREADGVGLDAAVLHLHEERLCDRAFPADLCGIDPGVERDVVREQLGILALELRERADLLEHGGRAAAPADPPARARYQLVRDLERQGPLLGAAEDRYQRVVRDHVALEALARDPAEEVERPPPVPVRAGLLRADRGVEELGGLRPCLQRGLEGLHRLAPPPHLGARPDQDRQLARVEVRERLERADRLVELLEVALPLRLPGQEAEAPERVEALLQVHHRR